MKNRIDEVLAGRNMTQQDLCDMADISRITLYKVRNGKSFPNPTTRKKICTALECDEKDIFYF